MVLSVLTSAAGASARRRTVLRQPRSHGSASSEKGLSSLPWPQCCSFAGCSARTRGRPPRPLGSACVRSSRTATCWSPPASTVRSLLAGWLPDESNGCPCGCVRARAVAPSLDGVSPRPAGWARCAALQASRACGTSRKGRSWQSAGATLARQALQQPRQPFGSLTARNGGGRTLYIAHISSPNEPSGRIRLRGYTNAAWDR